MSKLSRNLIGGISESWGLPIHHNKSMVKVAPTYKTKDRAMISNFKKTKLRHMQRRAMRSRRRTLESGVSSTKSPGTTLMNVT
jgi:hypothetical protein